MLKQRLDVVHDLIGAIEGPAFDVHDSTPAQCVDKCQSVTRSLAGADRPLQHQGRVITATSHEQCGAQCCEEGALPVVRAI